MDSKNKISADAFNCQFSQLSNLKYEVNQDVQPSEDMNINKSTSIKLLKIKEDKFSFLLTKELIIGDSNSIYLDFKAEYMCIFGSEVVDLTKCDLKKIIKDDPMRFTYEILVRISSLLSSITIVGEAPSLMLEPRLDDNFTIE